MHSDVDSFPWIASLVYFNGIAPMLISIVNPNTTGSMTAKIGAAARAAASPGVQIRAVNPEFGTPSIEGYFDEAFAVPGLLAEIAKAPESDAFIVACFDDTGLEAARCATASPVVGIGEAAFHMASLIADKFSVVTTLPRSIAPIEKNLVKYGLAARCARVRAANVQVLALEEPGSDARRKIEAEISRALAEEGAEAIVLGCAGMTDLARDLERKAGVPVLDGVACAVGLAEALIRLGLKTSKRNAYAPPLSKTYIGAFAEFSPR
jgi:allantoin racemase